MLPLLNQKDCAFEAFEGKKLVLSIFIDFTRVFDYLNHSILLGKLDYYRVLGVVLDLIELYLGHRYQMLV